MQVSTISFDRFNVLADNEAQARIRAAYFTLAASSWRYNGTQSLYAERLGLIAGYGYAPIRDYIEANKDTPRVQYAHGEDALQTNLQKLLRGRISLVRSDELAFRYTAQQMGLAASFRDAGGEPIDLRHPQRSGFASDSAYRPQFDSLTHQFALFAENRLQLTDRLALLTALRYDYLDMQVTNYGAVSPTSPAFFERRWEPLSGRIGLTYALTPTASVYAQYSSSADLPAGSLAAATYSNVGLFDLSKGEQWEVGSKFDFLDGRGAATLALYGTAAWRVEQQRQLPREYASCNFERCIPHNATLNALR